MSSNAFQRLSSIAIGLAMLAQSLLATAARATPPPSPPAAPVELVIYTYDSLLAKGGLGPAIFPLFEKQCHCRIKTVAVGDGAQLLTRLQLDQKRGQPTAHVVFGIDQNLWPELREQVQGGKVAGYDRIVAEARVGSPEEGFVPYDFGVFAFIADVQKLGALGLRSDPAAQRAISIQDLLKPELQRKLLLEDPRTSTPGLGLVLLSRELNPTPDAFKKFWQALRPQWLTLAPGWDAAYGLFLKGEAPLVWSYTSSQAYHAAHGDSANRYQAVLFTEGNPVQIEGAAVLKGSHFSAAQRAQAQAFVEFLLSPAVQSKVAETNWMFPAVRDVVLPASYARVPRPARAIRSDLKPGELKSLLQEWSRAIR